MPIVPVKIVELSSANSIQEHVDRILQLPYPLFNVVAFSADGHVVKELVRRDENRVNKTVLMSVPFEDANGISQKIASN